MSHSFVITLICPPSQVKLSSQHLSALTQELSSRGIHHAEPVWLAPSQACDVPISQPVDVRSLLSLRDLPIDLACLPRDGRKKKLLISDMDSTIIEQECIDELAAALGIGEWVAVITERAMNGELDFPAALRERVGLLKGLAGHELTRVYEQRIRLMGGARTLVQTMRQHGAHTMLVSGGFTFFTSKIREACGFHEDEANVLLFDGEALAGTVAEPILDKHAKLAALQRGCVQHNLTAADVLAAGDGANDLPMLQAAGLGVGYHGKPIVQNNVHVAINHCDLHALLFLQGYHENEFIAG